MALMTSYHQAAYTLDPDKQPPDEPLPAAGHDGAQAEEVAELQGAHREQVQAEREAAAEQAQAFAERDPKPLPSELLVESGREPGEDSEDPQSPQ
jgi:hypothetical protein